MTDDEFKDEESWSKFEDPFPEDWSEMVDHAHHHGVLLEKDGDWEEVCDDDEDDQDEWEEDEEADDGNEQINKLTVKNSNGN